MHETHRFTVTVRRCRALSHDQIGQAPDKKQVAGERRQDGEPDERAFCAVNWGQTEHS